jgi:hypothetical protein
MVLGSSTLRHSISVEINCLDYFQVKKTFLKTKLQIFCKVGHLNQVITTFLISQFSLFSLKYDLKDDVNVSFTRILITQLEMILGYAAVS